MPHLNFLPKVPKYIEPALVYGVCVYGFDRFMLLGLGFLWISYGF
jgi:hypothetical protein